MTFKHSVYISANVHPMSRILLYVKFIAILNEMVVST